MSDDVRQRRALVRRLLADGGVGTQEELRVALAAAGIHVTQATLSRDLASIGARRVHNPAGGTSSELPDAQATPSEDELAVARNLIAGLTPSLALVVVHTAPGAASAIAALLDRSRLAEVAGTIAGDDTIFVAPRRNPSADALHQRLASVWSLPL